MCKLKKRKNFEAAYDKINATTYYHKFLILTRKGEPLLPNGIYKSHAILMEN